MQYTEKQKIPGLLMLIDFEKAFDTISWNFIHSPLDFFNFGPSIKQWIYTFYNGIKSCVLQNGISSDYIYQGDPISPYLFLFVLKFLEYQLEIIKTLGVLD